MLKIQAVKQIFKSKSLEHEKRYVDVIHTIKSYPNLHKQTALKRDLNQDN